MRQAEGEEEDRGAINHADPARQTHTTSKDPFIRAKDVDQVSHRHREVDRPFDRKGGRIA